MPGLKLPRWLLSLWCRWLPGRAQARRRPVVRRVVPRLMMLEDRASPTSLNVAPPMELAPPPYLSQINSAMVATGNETRKTDTETAWQPSESIALVSAPRPVDDASVVVHTPSPFQYSFTSTGSEKQEQSELSSLPLLSSRPFNPLSSPPKPLANPPANAGGGGGGGIGGRSTPNAGMGGGGPTGGGGGPGLVNANQFVGVDFGASYQPAAQARESSNQPAAQARESAPLTSSQMSYSMTAPSLLEPHYQSLPARMSGGHGHSHDPLYVLDMNTGETIPASVTLNTLSTWSENLLAQVSGGTVSSYSWNVGQAPDLTNVTGTSTANLQGTWASFTGAARTDTISVTETPQSGQPITVTMTYAVAGTNSPAYSGTRPTSNSTWPTVITPDQLSSGQATQSAGPYASIGLADGSVQTSFSMPSYNPNTTPVSLDYNSTTANALPIFLDEYQLPTGQSVPSTITAQLTFNNTALATVTYNTSGFNPGDIVQIALQANATSLNTGRYPWSITVTNSGTPTTSSGNVDIVNQANSPFGAGWALDNVDQLVSVSGGVMLVAPGGTSLFFASNGSGGYITPADDFSTLTYSNGVYTRTMTDGTKDYFSGTGQETSTVDRDGNTTTFGYTSGQLTTITDMNNQVTSLAYNASGLLSTITDPAMRTATITYTGRQLTSITDPANDLWQYGYDSSNDLATLTDPNNHTTTFAYNSADRISNVTQPDSSTLKLTPAQMNGWAAAGSSNVTAVLLAAGDSALFTDGNNNAWTTGLDWLGYGQDVADIDPLGDASLNYINTNGLTWLSADALSRRTREFFDSNGNPTEIVNPDDSYSQSQYNNFSEVTQATDPTGDVTTYTYNSKGDMTQKEDALLNTYTYTYNAAGLVTSEEDPLLNTTTNGYNSLNEQTSVINALNQTVTSAYNNAGLVTSSTDAMGYVSTFAFDAMNRLTGKTLPDTSTTNSVYSYTYDKVGNQTSVTDPLNHTTTNVYNAVNETTATTNALNQTTTNTYDANGNQTSVTNPLNQTTTNTYNAANELVGVTNALNYTYRYSYDAAGEKVSSTNPLNQTTTYTYTPLGQMASETDPMGDLTQYSYNSAGDNTQISQVSGGGSKAPLLLQQKTTITMGYDALHQENSYIDQNGNQTTFGYNAVGSQTSVKDALNNTTTYGYNAINQQTSETDPLNNTITYTYNANGQQTNTTDPLNHTTTTTYDAQGRALTVKAPNGGVTTKTYDAAGNLLTLTDPDNNTTTYTYNAINEQVSTTNPLGYQATNAYNAAGLLTSTTDADGRTITYGFDAIGEKTSETWVGGNYTATYVYNAAGELTQASDPYSVYSYSYDAAGRLTSVSNAGTPGVPSVTLSYSYDSFSNMTGLTDSLGGSISYSYDNAKNLTGLSLSLTGTQTAAVTMAYDANNELTGLTRTAPSVNGDTITTSLTYDNSGRLTNITHKDATTLVTFASYTYSYDTAGRLTGYQDNNNSSLTYGYDANGELTSASGTLNGSNYAVSYSYDANGNRTMTGYKTGKGNELTSEGTYNYAYDNNGNTLTQTNIATGSVTYYTWDYRNRLTEMKQETSTGTVINDEKFTYDVNNNRMATSLNGTTQLYTVYEGSNPYMDFNGSGALTERYLFNPQALSQFYGQANTSGTTQWFLTDNISSVRQVVSTSGTVLDRITYDPFGGLITQTNSANAPRFLYTGGAYDTNTGDYQDGARYENPFDGRWLSQDPLGLSPDSNPYRYAANDPASLSDPSGLASVNKKMITYKIDEWTLEYVKGKNKGKVVNLNKLIDYDKPLSVPPGRATEYGDVTVTNHLPEAWRADLAVSGAWWAVGRWQGVVNGQSSVVTIAPNDSEELIAETDPFNINSLPKDNGRGRADAFFALSICVGPPPDEPPNPHALGNPPLDLLVLLKAPFRVVK